MKFITAGYLISHQPETCANYSSSLKNKSLHNIEIVVRTLSLYFSFVKQLKEIMLPIAFIIIMLSFVSRN